MGLLGFLWIWRKVPGGGVGLFPLRIAVYGTRRAVLDSMHWWCMAGAAYGGHVSWPDLGGGFHEFQV